MSASRQKEEVTPIAPDEKSSSGGASASEVESVKETGRPDLVKEIHLRIPLHIVIPIAALIFVGVVALLFGLFLLKLPKEHAPAVALALAINILAATTFAASRKKLSLATVVELCALVIYPVALAVILVNLGAVEPVSEATEAAAPAAEEAAAEATPVTIGAENLEFTEDELTFPADQATTLEFDNPDAAPHNVSIYADDSLDEDFFIGQNVEPGDSTEYEIPALAAGAYYFQCDLHPTMNGRVIVE